MKIAVLVSGGVDSSVALALLKSQGLDVTAFYLKIWLEDELSYLGDCPWQEDLQYVEAVCKQLHVPLHIISLQKEYWNDVVKQVIEEIKQGRTPNPDILCNQRIKFGAFWHAIDTSFDKIATGHYAQVIEHNGIYSLHKSPDPVKDQTYFLSHLSQDQLSRALFPIGHLHKKEVRKLAQEFNLPTKDRKDSQGICFLGKFKFSEFLRAHVGERPGKLIEFETGTVLGEHQGFWFYTIGQRQGLGLAGGPWYVVAKDAEKNIIFISRAYYTPEKERNTLIIGNCNWLEGQRPTITDCEIKLRHGERSNNATVSFDDDKAHILLHERDQGIAPGQYAVLYEGNKCLGSGIIQ